MLAVVMKILSILGIILLVLLCILTALLLIVLFIPIVYRLDAEKEAESVRADFKLRWLFGLLRAGYSYPEPGRMIVKVLWFTVFDSGKTTKKDTAPGAKEKETAPEAKEKNASADNASADAAKTRAEQQTDTQTEASSGKEKQSAKERIAEDCAAETASEKTAEAENEENKQDFAEAEEAGKNDKKTLQERLFAKYEKIKYTILKIYDKIKDILENLSFYKRLLQDEETKLLFSHTCGRIGKVLHHIRPRRIEADVTFGTGSPDTTGYAYAVYGMLSPHLGKEVCITPDFTQAILEGRLHAAGHITVFTLLINLLAVLLDRRLRLFIRRIRAHSGKYPAAGGEPAQK